MYVFYNLLFCESVFNAISDFNNRNKCLSAKLIKAIDIQTTQIKHGFKQMSFGNVNLFYFNAHGLSKPLNVYSPSR